MTFEIDFVTFGGSGTPLFVTFAIDFFYLWAVRGSTLLTFVIDLVTFGVSG